MDKKIWSREIPIFFQDIIEVFIEKNFKVGDKVSINRMGDFPISRIDKRRINVGEYSFGYDDIATFTSANVSWEEISIYRKMMNKICRSISKISDDDFEKAYKIALCEDNLLKVYDKLAPILDDAILLKRQVEELLK